MLSTSARSLQMAWEVVRKSVPRECLEAHEITWTILLVFASVWLHIIVYPITFCLELCWCKFIIPSACFSFSFYFSNPGRSHCPPKSVTGLAADPSSFHVVLVHRCLYSWSMCLSHSKSCELFSVWPLCKSSQWALPRIFAIIIHGMLYLLCFEKILVI